jgi:Spy/CpxP family protein refolding chaperone
VLRSEPKAVGAILTPKQRDTVRNDFQGRGVIDIPVDPNDPQAAAMPKETIAGRPEGTAEKLGLTQEQRDKIRAIDPGLAAKCTAQREQREALRMEELQAMGDILTPQKRKRVKNGFADGSDGP